MSNNGFREEELITRNMNGQTRVFPVVGGRLRLAHEQNETLSLQTEMVNWDGQYAVFKCRAVTAKGDFVGYGTANHQRDARLAESLIELAETRSIARALRFAGYGMEYCGAEEVSHVGDSEQDPERNGEQRPENSTALWQWQRQTRIKTATLRQWSGHSSTMPSFVCVDQEGSILRTGH
jgi:hypothetical protein